MELLRELGIFGTGIVMAITVAGLGWRGDEAVSPALRESLSSWLQRLDTSAPPPRWPVAFIAMFDHLFGKDHLSWRCFLRSCLASVIAVLILNLVFFNLRPDEWLEIKEHWTSDAIQFLLFLFVVVALNLIPDFVSLLESRFMIQMMARYQSGIAIVTLLIVDAVLTMLIFAMIGGLFLSVLLSAPYSIEEIGEFWSTFYKFVFEILPSAAKFESGSLRTGYVGIFIYSTFFTSIWVWLWAIGWGSLRLAARLVPVLRFLQWALPIETHPVRALGETAAIFTCLGYWVYAAAMWSVSAPEAPAALGQ